MAFKMAGFSAFTKKEKKEYEPQTKAGGREYEDKVRRSDLDEEGKKIFDSKEYEPQSTRIYLDDEYKVGDYANEDDFEAQFKQKGDKAKNYPQLSVEDYSTVKKDARGFYVTKKED
tara:strand:- start:615 stop:962 length:348 start_codon:yes stop_codon:yes gene_type:complete